MDEVKKIVLTGGPCAWKTSALCFLHDELSGKGWSVVTVPEVATLFFTHQIKIGTDGLSPLDFQRELLRMQLTVESTFSSMLEKYKNPKRVLICDRGVLDAKAYVSPGEFQELLSGLGLSEGMLLSRYHGAIHLVTAADGAEDFYTFENNPARTETPDEARALDLKTQHAWVGHPHLRVIPNLADGLEGKKRRLLASICRVLGIPVPLEIELKFLIAEPDLAEMEACYNLTIVPADIEQIYLTSTGDVDRRIRKRTQTGHEVYYYTEKKRLRDGVRSEVERFIDSSTYEELSREQEPGSAVIRKTRHYFVWKHQYFELDLLKEPVELALLEIELTEENERVEFPPFIQCAIDVTNNPGFTNHAISRIHKAY